MDFAVLPPEINSSRMYTGPGVSPLLTAASAWDRLADDLAQTSRAYRQITNELCQEWLGTSARQMSDAESNYINWLDYTSTLAQQTAHQLKSFAAAYEEAFNATIPPEVVYENRQQHAYLIATNRFGNHAGAIAANEARYADMWIQNATAMYRYASHVAHHTLLTPFQHPPHTTNEATTNTALLTAEQASMLATQNQLHQVFTHINTALGSLAAPQNGTLLPFLGPNPELEAALLGLDSDLFGTFVLDTLGTFGFDVIGTFGIDMIGVGEIGVEIVPEIAEIVPEILTVHSISPIGASMGHATHIHKLSVPYAWSQHAPMMNHYPTMASASHHDYLETPVSSHKVSSGLSLGQITMAGVAGGVASTLTRSGTTVKKGLSSWRNSQEEEPDKFNPSIRSLNGPITKISGELRELAALRDGGILTEEEFQTEKQRLLSRS